MRYPYFPFKMYNNQPNEIRIFSPYDDNDIIINQSAAIFLKLCNGSRSQTEIVKILCSHFKSSEKEIRSHVNKLVLDFEGSGILWVREAKMRWFDAPPPESIFWEITAECNLKCLHCVVSADKKQDGELSTFEGLNLIQEWQRMGVHDITFSGGEPLMRKDFFELAHAANKQNFTIGLATNGTCITPSIANELKKLNVNIQVSLDGSDAEIYGKFRGHKKAFEKATKGIELLSSAGHDITIGTVISNHNIDDIPEMLNLVQDFGVKHFRLIPFIPYGRGRDNSNLELAPERVREVSSYLIEERKTRPFEIMTLEFEHTFSAPPSNKIDLSQPSECGGAIHYCTVTPEGEVLPCHYFEGVYADNVKEKSFSQIWKSSRFLNYFRSLQISDIEGFCKQCDWLPVCRGGCKAANFSHGTLFHSNRHCWIASKNVQTESLEPIS